MIAHLNVTSLSHLHCWFDFYWRSDFFPLLGFVASRTVTSYGPQAAQANEEPPPKSSLDLTLTQHLVMKMKNSNFERCVLVLKLNPLEPGIIVFLRTPAPWWSCCKSTLLLVTNPRLFTKVVTKLKILLSLHGLQFSALVTIVGCAARFVDCFPMARRTT